MAQACRIALALLLVTLFGGFGWAADPPVPDIPGITAADRFPGGCVDCHVNRPDMNRDLRISAHIREWQAHVDPHLLAKLRAMGGAAARLSGQHPALPAETYADVPARCIACHASPEAKTVPLSQLLHVLHLTGGKDNHFVTIFHAQCTYCHKLDSQAGTWSVPSGPEKQ